MTARTGLDLQDIVVTKPSRRIFEDEETVQIIDELNNLAREFGWKTGGVLDGSGVENLRIDFLVYKPDGSDFTDEEVKDFEQKLDWLIISRGLLCQGEPKLVDSEGISA